MQSESRSGSVDGGVLQLDRTSSVLQIQSVQQTKDMLRISNMLQKCLEQIQEQRVMIDNLEAQVLLAGDRTLPLGPPPRSEADYDQELSLKMELVLENSTLREISSTMQAQHNACKFDAYRDDVQSDLSVRERQHNAMLDETRTKCSAEQAEIFEKLQMSERVWQDERKRLTEDRNNLAVMYEGLLAESSSIKKSYKAVKDDLDTCKHQLDDSRADIGSLNARIRSLIMENSRMQEASKVNKKLAIENAELKKKLDDFKVPSSMSMEFGDIKEKIKALTMENARLVAQRNSDKTLLTKAQGTIQKLTEDNAVASTSIDNLRMQNKSLLSELARVKALHYEALSQVEQYKDKTESLSYENRLLRSKASS